MAITVSCFGKTVPVLILWAGLLGYYLWDGNKRKPEQITEDSPNWFQKVWSSVGEPKQPDSTPSAVDDSEGME